MAKFVISALAAATALTAVSAHAQETHTLTPHYPDNFKVEATYVKDSEQIGQGRHITTHTKMVVDETVQKTDTGYKGTFVGVSTEANSHDADGKPNPQGEMQARLTGLITSVGPVLVTFDKGMTPQSIDNIDDIKPRIKQALTGTGDAKADAQGVQLYDAFIANLTPTSAAAFLKQTRQAGAEMVYNHPLPLHQPVSMDSTAVQLMGSSLRLNGTVTLDDWNESQRSAAVTMVLTPSEADLHTFISGLANNLMARFASGGDSAAAKTLFDRIIDNMHMTMSVTCHMTLDLDNYAVNHTVCDSTSNINIDLAKAMPPDLAKQKPALAQMPVITLTQTDHSNNETRLIP